MRDSMPLLDRMPCRARAAPLTPALSIFETFTRGKAPRQYRDQASGELRMGKRTTVVWAAAPTSNVQNVNRAGIMPRQPTDAECSAYRKLCLQNVTCFHHLEEAHPINFFEQRNICPHCGAERYVTMNEMQCCQGGKLVLDRQMPSALLSLISEAPGFSKQSRAGNDLFRFAQMALPKGK